MLARARSHSALICALIFLAMGLLLNDGPYDPDVRFPLAKLLGVFFVFVSMSLAVMAWGDLTRRWLRLRALVLVPVLGTGFAAIVACALAHLGRIGLHAAAPDLFLLYLGLPLRSYFQPTRAAAPRRIKVAAWSSLAALLVLLSFILATHPSSYPDPLYYHLLAPRLWFDWGGARFERANSLLYQAGYWEYLGLWPNTLLAGAPGRGLIEVQIASQWMHALFGLGGTVLALGALVESPSAVFFGVTAAVTLVFASTAKSDWGAIAWITAGFALLRDRGSFTRQRFAGGVLLGLGAATKWTTLCWIIPAFAFFASVPAASGLILACLPVLIRNFAATGNPVFPTFDGVFPSVFLADPRREYLSGFLQHSIVFAKLPGHALLLARDLILGAPSVVGLVFAPIALSGNRDFKIWLTVLAIVFSILLLITGPDYPFNYWRLTGPAPVMAGALGGVAVIEALKRVRARGLRRALTLSLISLMGFVLYDQVYSSEIPRLHMLTDPVTAIRAHAAGEIKAWFRMHASSEDRIITGGDVETYYLSHFKIDSLEDDAELDRALARLRGPRQMISVLAQRGRYLLDTWRYGYPQPWGRSMARLYPALNAHPEAIAYQSHDGRLYDLPRLNAVVQADPSRFLDEEPRIEKKVNP